MYPFTFRVLEIISGDDQRDVHIRCYEREVHWKKQFPLSYTAPPTQREVDAARIEALSEHSYTEDTELTLEETVVLMPPRGSLTFLPYETQPIQSYYSLSELSRDEHEVTAEYGEPVFTPTSSASFLPPPSDYPPLSAAGEGCFAVIEGGWLLAFPTAKEASLYHAALKCRGLLVNIAHVGSEPLKLTTSIQPPSLPVNSQVKVPLSQWGRFLKWRSGERLYASKVEAGPAAERLKTAVRPDEASIILAAIVE